MGKTQSSEPVNSFERQLVDLGISVATAFSLPRSVGSIFGLIFASADPIGLEDIIHKLEISRGSASMGLNFLLKMGAIQAIPPPGGTRRTLYEPEMSLRRLLDGVLQATILPHLNESTVKIDQLYLPSLTVLSLKFEKISKNIIDESCTTGSNRRRTQRGGTLLSECLLKNERAHLRYLISPRDVISLKSDAVWARNKEDRSS